jgi:hypothetical protein
MKIWFFKLKSKNKQNRELLLAQIKEAGEKLCEIRSIQVQPQLLEKRRRGENCDLSIV